MCRVEGQTNKTSQEVWLSGSRCCVLETKGSHDTNYASTKQFRLLTSHYAEHCTKRPEEHVERKGNSTVLNICNQSSIMTIYLISMTKKDNAISLSVTNPPQSAHSSSDQSSESSSLSCKPSMAARLELRISMLKKPQTVGSSTTGLGGAGSTFLRLDKPPFTAMRSSSMKSLV